LSKTGGIASYFEEFANEASAKDGLKLRCQNVKLFLREPYGKSLVPIHESSMTWNQKKEKLKEIYERFEIDARAYKQHAICKVGCTYCCTDVGNVDINTLEGLVIYERIKSFPQPRKEQIQKRLAQNKREKEKRNIAPCPFLKKDDTCLIYDIRPFSCRQLYSIRECRGRGPTVHRQAVALAKKAVREMQQLDGSGYSGHLSFILYLIERPEFRSLYLAGGFDPQKIMKFGKAHGIIINHLVR